ncbi:hypothetical protein IscW_ISCW004671, partial [Ixodes scapularis]
MVVVTAPQTRCLKLARELVEARELAAQAKNRTRYDRRRYEQTFHPGNLVYAGSPTAECQMSLQFQFHRAHNTVSTIVADVCPAIYSALKDDFLKTLREELFSKKRRQFLDEKKKITVVRNDHSRVVLRRGDKDYINASLVEVKAAKRSYILTQ